MCECDGIWIIAGADKSHVVDAEAEIYKYGWWIIGNIYLWIEIIEHMSTYCVIKWKKEVNDNKF